VHFIHFLLVSLRWYNGKHAPHAGLGPFVRWDSHFRALYSRGTGILIFVLKTVMISTGSDDAYIQLAATGYSIAILSLVLVSF
jgi:hypothetical protein